MCTPAGKFLVILYGTVLRGNFACVSVSKLLAAQEELAAVRHPVVVGEGR